jgi:hypothetical protein
VLVGSGVLTQVPDCFQPLTALTLPTPPTALPRCPASPAPSRHAACPALRSRWRGCVPQVALTLLFSSKTRITFSRVKRLTSVSDSKKGRTSATTRSQVRVCKRWRRASRQLSSVSLPPGQPVCCKAWLRSVRLGAGQLGSLSELDLLGPLTADRFQKPVHLQ